MRRSRPAKLKSQSATSEPFSSSAPIVATHFGLRIGCESLDRGLDPGGLLSGDGDDHVVALGGGYDLAVLAGRVDP